jgi:hypothetical protein
MSHQIGSDIRIVIACMILGRLNDFGEAFVGNRAICFNLFR